jgi:lysophospholipase L1-like esterase
MIRRNIRIGTIFVMLLLSNLEAHAIYIAAFGDSITRGWDYHTDNAKGTTDGGYIPSLQSKLVANNWGEGASITVRNWGFPGEKLTNGGRERFTSLVVDVVPDYALIMEGTNDLSANIGPGAIVNLLDSMVSEALAAGQVPVMGTLLPRYDHASWVNITGVNSGIKTNAANRGVEVADLYSASSNWNSLMWDGLHPTLSGYALMADVWFGALVNHKEKLAALKLALERAKIAGSMAGINNLLLLSD